MDTKQAASFQDWKRSWQEENGPNNYILRAASIHRWVGFSVNEINKYKKHFGSNFNLVLCGHENKDNDYYCIPFSVVEHLFTSEHLTDDDTPGRSQSRWTANIDDHIFKMHGGSEYSANVGSYYGTLSTQPLKTNKLEDVYDLEYFIEDARAEIGIRIGQSKFREQVLANFRHRSCVTGIGELDLLVASHIVPWSKNKNLRSDPSNGLCLCCEIDSLFDNGYISFDDDLRIIITPLVDSLSQSLGKRLMEIDGTIADKPRLYPIKASYLEYHRNNVLRKTEVK